MVKEHSEKRKKKRKRHLVEKKQHLEKKIKKIKEKINEEELWDRLKTVNAEFKKIKEAKKNSAEISKTILK